MWTPFYLSIAAICLYIPHVLLSYMSTNAIDMDIQKSLIKARSLARKTGAITEDSVSEIADNMKRILDRKRIREPGCLNSMVCFIHKVCPLLIPSKQNGTVLTWIYQLVAIMYLSISIIIVFGMAAFLSYNNPHEYITSLINFINGQNDAINRFPQLSYAMMPIEDHTGINYYPLECVLPINMVWQKLFMMLSLWMIGIVIINFLKLINILVNTRSRRESFVKDMLTIRVDGAVMDVNDISTFTEEYLKHDGVMILKSILSNSNNSAASYIVWILWNKYLEKCRQTPTLVISKQ